MLEVEIQKLTAAIEALTKTVQEMARPTLVVTNGTPTNVTTLEEAERSYREDDAAREKMQAERDQKLADLYKAEQAKTKRKAAKVTVEETKALIEASTDRPQMDKIPEGLPDITETSLKTMALEIVRVNSSARETVLELLGEYDAKTFTQLSPKHHRAVHAKLSAIAAEVGSV